jgi:hypothetical protein
MKGIPWVVATLALAMVCSSAVACGGAKSADEAGDGGVGAGGDAGGAVTGTCTPCQSDGDCGGGICVNLPGGAYCATACDTNAACTSDTTCAPVEGVASGGQVGACVARGGVCGVAPSGDAGAPSPAVCGDLAGPSTPAACPCPSGRTCSANGCRYQQYCDTRTSTCTPAPIGCGTPGASYDGGVPPSGTVGGNGGSVSRLYFAVVGDTRPANEDDTTGYPTAVITRIYQALEALSPPPAFAVATGDYQFAAPSGSEGAAQVDLYMGARAKYSGALFPAMGNHECTGATASNCGSGNTNGTTNNYNAFLTKMLAPIGQTSPYYEIDLGAADGSWTAKLLFVAANAWTQTQANWLDQAMARPTTYTFLVRHEPANATSAPGVGPAENIMLMHPYTLSIVGHVHTYQRSGSREITIGNGGAPLSGTADYGFAMLSQQADGSIAVDMIDYTSGLADPSFHFAVKPDGSSAE